MKVALLSILACFAVFATGCSDRCHAVCDEVNACNITQRSHVDCDSYCADIASLGKRAQAASQSSCASQFNDSLSCWEQHSGNVCDPNFDGCAAVDQAWTDCMSAYCANAPADEPSCANGAPAISPF